MLKSPRGVGFFSLPTETANDSTTSPSRTTSSRRLRKIDLETELGAQRRTSQNERNYQKTHPLHAESLLQSRFHFVAL